MHETVMHQTGRLSYDGAVDADGHILEPPDLWERYLEPKYRDRALRIVKDDHGLDELEIDGKRSMMTRRGFPSTLASMGRMDLAQMARDPEVTYDNHAAFGSTDAKERLELLDAEHIDAAVLYTTIGLLWEAELDDAELSQAYTRAYNRWICEFCSESGGRLVPAAHLSLSDPVAAARRARPRRRRGRSRRLRRAVHAHRQAARPSRQRRRVRRRAGPRRAVRHPPDVRAAVDEGQPHGRVGERAASCASSRRCRRPTACATSSRRCSTTACSTSSRS